MLPRGDSINDTRVFKYSSGKTIWDDGNINIWTKLLKFKTQVFKY